MNRKFYFDTSIWLDFFENRDEPNLPKGKWAKALVRKIISKSDKIVYSDLTLIELEGAGYSRYDVEDLLKPLSLVILFVETTEKQLGKSKDLSFKRNIPRKDALHALIARDIGATLVTLDHHFQRILDIIKPFRTNELIG